MGAAAGGRAAAHARNQAPLDRAALRHLNVYLSDKTAWPTPAKFRAVGFGQLRAAIRRSGGIDT